MKYMMVVDDEFISNFRVDIKSDSSSHFDKVLVVTDRIGFMRAIELKPLSTDYISKCEKIEQIYENWNNFIIDDDDAMYDIGVVLKSE